MHLLDTNVWLALSFGSHSQHLVAKHWFDSIANGPCVFCRVTQMGFLRLATNPMVLPLDAVTLSQAWTMYDSIVASPRISFADEPTGLDARWRRNAQGKTFSPKIWNDAYLAAFAEAANLALVTFDKGFAQFGLNKLTLLP